MIKKITSFALMAMLSATAFAADGDDQKFDSYFRTLPTEAGKGVVTSLRYNGNWVGYKKAPGSGISGTWAKFNNPWGGNGRCWLECVGNGEYILAGQGCYLMDFDENNRSITSTTGARQNALRFKAIPATETDSLGQETVVPGKFHFMTTDGRFWIQADGDGNNMIYREPVQKTVVEVDDDGNETVTIEDIDDKSTWEIGTWQGVGFARLDVKPWNGHPGGGGNIKKCDDGYYYGILCLPFAVEVPNLVDSIANFFPGTDQVIPNFKSRLVNVWQLGGFGDNIEVTPLEGGAVIPGGTCIMVRATEPESDFLIATNSEYIDKPDNSDNLFQGYYTEMPDYEVFYLTVDEGYPKFKKGIMYDDISHPELVVPGERADQRAVNTGYIAIFAGENDEDVVEYRFDFEQNTLTPYDDIDWARTAQFKLKNWLTDANTGGDFQIPKERVAEMQEILDNVDPGMHEDDYNDLVAQFKAAVSQPDIHIGAIKRVRSTNYMGDRHQGGDAEGLHSNFGTPNGANGRAYFKRVGPLKYILGFNGQYVQAPVLNEDGEAKDDEGNALYIGMGDEPVTFDVVIGDTPGQFALAVDGIALNDADKIQATSLYDSKGALKTSGIYYQVNHDYDNFILGSVSYQFEEFKYQTVCVPFTVTADIDNDPDAQLYKLRYNDNDDIEMYRVDQLEAGEPGLYSGTKDVRLLIDPETTAFALRPVTDVDNPLVGIFTRIPADGEVQNMHVLGISTNTEIIGEDDDAQYVTTTALALVLGTPEINHCYWEGGANADDVPIVMPEKDWGRAAERDLAAYLSDDNVGQPFQVTADKADALRLQLAMVRTEQQYNNLLTQILAAVSQPETIYTALKSGTQYMGDRRDGGRLGMYSNFGTPNGANGRAYLSKVADGQYTLGFNGRYVQAPVDGMQPELATEPFVFDLTIVRPGTITLSHEGLYLHSGNTLVGSAANDGGAEWTLDKTYAGWVRVTTDVTCGDLRFGTVCVPYTIRPNTDKDPAAALYTVSGDLLHLTLNRVEELPAGVPAIAASSAGQHDFIVVGGFVTAPQQEGTPLTGILNASFHPYEDTALPQDNPYFLQPSAENPGQLCMMAWGSDFDINKCYINDQDAVAAYADELPFDRTPSQADGIDDITLHPSPSTQHPTPYTIAGQPVSASYRGLVIVDGRVQLRK